MASRQAEPSVVTDNELVDWTHCDEPPYGEAWRISPDQVTNVLGRIVTQEVTDGPEVLQVQVATAMAAMTGNEEAVDVLGDAAMHPERSVRQMAMMSVRYFIGSRPSFGQLDQPTADEREQAYGEAVIEGRLRAIAIELRDTDPDKDVRKAAAKAFLR
jgi:hypothetical protein